MSGAASPTVATPPSTIERASLRAVVGYFLRLGARQHVAEVERADELFLVEPLRTLHDLQVHQADLADRSAKGELAELEEVPEDLPHRDLARLAIIDWHGRRLSSFAARGATDAACRARP